MRQHSLRTVVLPSLLIAAAFAAPRAFAGEDAQKAVKESIQENLDATQAKDIARVGKTIHPDSPALAGTLAAVQMLKDYNLAFTLDEYHFVGQEGGYAHVRWLQTTRQKAGDKPFRDNRIEQAGVFKKDKDGKWKLMSSCVLKIEFL